MDRRLDRALGHLYVELDATDAQKAAIAPIVQAAVQDLLPVRARMLEARGRAVELLSRDTVDRDALETLRADQVALREQASRRLVQALADLAEAVFRPFHPFPGERAGTGLGLALVREIARKHGGDARSVGPPGSRFVVTLGAPARDPAR